MEKAHISIEMTSITSEEVKLPKLDTSGKEWTTWKAQLQVIVASQGLSEYLLWSVT